MKLAIVREGQKKFAVSDMVTGYTSTVCHVHKYCLPCAEVQWVHEPRCHALISETDWLGMTCRQCCTILRSHPCPGAEGFKIYIYR